MKTPTILVTGASGFIGSAVTIDLAHDHSVIAIDRRPPSRALRDRAPAVTWHQADIADESALAAVFRGTQRRCGRIDLVLHFAAYYHFGLDWRSEYQRTNIDGTINLVRLAAETGVRRLLFASSVIAMLPPPPGEVLNEESSTADYIPYARSKSIGERVVRDASDRLPSAVLRIGGVFSDWCELPPLYSLIELWSGRWPHNRIVIGHGDTGFPYIHRSDLVRLVRACTERRELLDSCEVLLACQHGTVLHRDLFSALHQGRGKGSGTRPIFVSPTVAGVALFLRATLGWATRRLPFERRWMLQYADRPWVADTTHTREKLDWDCTAGMGVCERLPAILDHFALDPAAWNERKRARLGDSPAYPLPSAPT
jgi:nucleoside-diphosphate-sugar epimerase